MEFENSLSEYSFGQLLKRLLSVSHQKSYVLAGYLNYDVSYISKWVTGSMLPASKHAASMCSGIADFIVDNTDEIVLKQLYDMFEVTDSEKLRIAINTALIHAYQLSGAQRGKSKSILVSNENNSRTVVNPNLQKLYIKVNPRQSSADDEKVGMAMVIDLCALGKEDKMSISTVERDNHFFDNIDEIHYLISLTPDILEPNFDPLLLTLMLNSYSDLNFILSYYKHVPCSLMFAVQNYCMHMSVVAQNHRAILSDTSMDQGIANETYDTIISLERSFGKKLVRQEKIRDIIDSKEYLSFVISTDMYMYTTRLDEMLLPDEVFLGVLGSIDAPKETKQQLKILHDTFISSIGFSDIHIALLERSLQNYVIDGKLDFFGYPVETTVEQREQHLNYIKELMSDSENGVDIRFIDPQTLVDFDGDFTPCIYVSDCVSYIRLTASNEPDRISVIESTKLMDVYTHFMKLTFGTEGEASASSLNRITRMLRMLKK